MPIGNLTSQFFANIYLDPLDVFLKQTLRVPVYLRYADDFVILGTSEAELRALVPTIQAFLEKELRVTLHPKKIRVRSYYHGLDFLGCVVLPHRVVLRTKTKRRMLRKLREKWACAYEGTPERAAFDQSLQAYGGLMSHFNTYRLRQEIQLLTANERRRYIPLAGNGIPDLSDKFDLPFLRTGVPAARAT